MAPGTKGKEWREGRRTGQYNESNFPTVLVLLVLWSAVHVCVCFLYINTSDGVACPSPFDCSSNDHIFNSRPLLIHLFVLRAAWPASLPPFGCSSNDHIFTSRPLLVHPFCSDRGGVVYLSPSLDPSFCRSAGICLILLYGHVGTPPIKKAPDVRQLRHGKARRARRVGCEYGAPPLSGVRRESMWARVYRERQLRVQP